MLIITINPDKVDQGKMWDILGGRDKYSAYVEGGLMTIRLPGVQQTDYLDILLSETAYVMDWDWVPDDAEDWDC